ncbi:hypothetical protein M5689_020545 [Euphorbia peplus]|nr:hypothetical protein M5689_020545 [Euphorbia peplus]
MKASLKFRDDQKPLVRAKVPLSILGMPFQSGIVAGESKELSLNLATFFESGPSIKIAYRPNDSWNPFSLIIKTGTGAFGSPSCSSMLMSAEFNLVGKGNPSFMLHFKPRFGDFSIKKSQSSLGFEKSGNVIGSLVDGMDDGSIEVVDSPVMNGNGNGFAGVNGFSGKKISGVSPVTARAIVGAFSGVEVAARTELPVRNHAVMNFRWGVRVPAEIKGGIGADSAATFNLRKIPFLVMNKIGIEHVDDSKSKQKSSSTLSKLGSSENSDVAETCIAVKRQLEVLQSENGLLKKAVEDLRHEITGGKFSFPAQDFNSSRYSDRNGAKNITSSRNERRGYEKKSEGDVNEELKKASKGASNVGA